MKYLLILCLFIPSLASAEPTTLQTLELKSAGEDATCFARVQVSQQRLFSNQRAAQQFCSGFGGFNNLCVVRQYSRNLFGSNFNGVVQANGRSFFGALGRVIQFLNDNGLLNDIFNFVIQLLQNEDASCG